MPSYPYKCPKCGEYQEITKPMAESDKEERCQFSREIIPAHDQPGEVEFCDGILVRDFSGQQCNFQLRGRGWTGKIKKS